MKKFFLYKKVIKENGVERVRITKQGLKDYRIIELQIALNGNN